MNAARQGHACNVIKDEQEIIVAGGTNTEYSYLDSVEIYNRAENAWRNAANLPNAEMSFARSSGLTMWAIRTVENQIYRYDVAGDSWEQLQGVVSPGNTQGTAWMVVDQNEFGCQAPTAGP